MRPYAVLELSLVQPLWLSRLPFAVTALVLLSLVLTPLAWPYAVAVSVFCAAALWRFARQHRARSGFRLLRVHGGDAMTLVDRENLEHPVIGARCFWLIRHLVVMELTLGRTRHEIIVVPRAGNETESFRRLSIVCRYRFAVTPPSGQNGFQIPHQRSTK